MALSRDEKGVQLIELTEKMKKSQSVFFAQYLGLSVLDVSDLRGKLKAADAEMKVAKKTLMQIAAKQAGLPDVPENVMEGGIACIFSFADPMTGAQIAFKYSKEHPQVVLVGGIFDGKVIGKEEAISIAKIPGKQQLLAMFAAMCNGPLSSFARGLSELAKQKEVPTKEEPKVEAPKAEEPKAEAAPAAEAAPTPESPASEAPASDAPTA